MEMILDRQGYDVSKLYIELFQNFDDSFINRENRRNLWHVNELYSSDSVDSHPRIGCSEYTEIED